MKFVVAGADPRREPNPRQCSLFHRDRFLGYTRPDQASQRVPENEGLLRPREIISPAPTTWCIAARAELRARRPVVRRRGVGLDAEQRHDALTARRCAQGRGTNSSAGSAPCPRGWRAAGDRRRTAAPPNNSVHHPHCGSSVATIVIGFAETRNQLRALGAIPRSRSSQCGSSPRNARMRLEPRRRGRCDPRRGGSHEVRPRGSWPRIGRGCRHRAAG